MSVSKTFTDGDDLFNVNSEDDYSLNFLGGNDRLTTYKGTTTALMGDGDDRVVIRGGTVTADGEAGNDRFDFLADSSGVSLTGGTGADSFFGNGHSISGSIYGGDGDDSFYNFGRIGGQSVSLYGGAANDLYRVEPGIPPAIVEYENEGVDTVQVAPGASYTLAANLENLSVVNFATVAGTPVLRGNDLDNIIRGGSLGETLYGMDGNDTILGNGGTDILWGVNGNDRLYGGDGNDELHGQAGNDLLNGQGGDDVMIGGAGDDSYFVDSFGDLVMESSDLSGGTDTVRETLSSYTLPDGIEIGIQQSGDGLTGNADDNSLYGWNLAGGAGNDSVYSSGGGTLWGNDGDDTLYAAFCDLIGGAGADTFTFVRVGDEVGCQILDFQAGLDKVDVSVIDANTTVAGNQAFTVVSAFTGHAGELMIHLPGFDEDYAVIWTDVNGDGHVDMAILLKWEYDITASDIIL